MNNPIGLYIHWPFCEKKCPYCDFNSHASHNFANQSAYKDALQKEMIYFRGRLGNRTIKTIFFGGGTPSLMATGFCEDLLSQIYKLWPIDDQVEITLEANPSSVETKKFKSYRQAGVNRLSLGVQALDDESLSMLGRVHNAQEAFQAMSQGAEIFDRFSFDLIYSRPGQTLKSWQKELEKALQFAKGHISLYQLTIEKGTAFYNLYRKGQLQVLNDELSVDLYQMTDDYLESYNMPAYEISNFAKKGHESKHNLTYWRYKEYIGIGPGAHSRFFELHRGRVAAFMEYHPENWLKNVISRGCGIKQEEVLSLNQQGDEMLLMGLRLTEEFSLSRYQELSKRKISSQAIQKLVKEGLLQKSCKDTIKVTKKGRSFLNYIIVALAT